MLNEENNAKSINTWFTLYKDLFSDELKIQLETNMDFYHFLFDIYRKIMKRLPFDLLELMQKQYPVFKTENRPLLLEEINSIASTTGYSLLFDLYHLLNNQRQGVNLREKYTELEDWKNFYASHNVDMKVND